MLAFAYGGSYRGLQDDSMVGIGRGFLRSSCPAPLLKQGQELRTTSRWLFSISKSGDSTTFLGNLW